MPILIFDGEISGPYERPDAPGPCEWCGVPTGVEPGEEAHPVPGFASDEIEYDRTGPDFPSISTRMCGGCRSLYYRILSDAADECGTAIYF